MATGNVKKQHKLKIKIRKKKSQPPILSLNYLKIIQGINKDKFYLYKTTRQL